MNDIVHTIGFTMASIKLDPRVTKAAAEFASSILGAAQEAALDEIERQVQKGAAHINGVINNVRSRKNRTVRVRPR